MKEQAMTAPVGDRPSVSFGETDWFEWAQRNARKLGYGLGAVALAMLIVLYVSVSGRRKEAAASQRLTQARGAAESGNLPLAALELSQITEQFGGTKAAAEAAILLAQVRLVQGQVDIAVTSLREFVASRQPDYARASAYGLLGGGLETQGRLREAGEAYQRAAELARLDFQKAGYLLDAGRVLAAAGDSSAARQVLTDLLRRFGELDQAAEARVRLAELGGEVPEPAPGRTERRR